jgi:hypothetical protein
MIRRAIPALVLACAACQYDASPQGLQVTPASAFTEPRADSASPVQEGAYLVWSADSAGAETVWIDAAGQVAATRPQVVIAAGGGLWAWSTGQGKTTGVDCTCVNRGGYDGKAPCSATGEAEIAGVTDLASGRRIPLIPIPQPGEPGDEQVEQAPVEQAVIPLASAGPYLFTEVQNYGNACGAHGFEYTDVRVFDLASGGRAVDMVEAGDTAAVVSREGARARAALEAAEAATLPVDSVYLSSVEPRWTADGKLNVEYRFSAPACYACGDGRNAYMTSTLVRAASPPAKLAALAEAPEAVRRWWQAHPPRAHAGWSAAPAAALGAFQTPAR